PRPEACRGIIVGPGVNQPDPFPGYGGFVGWESPVRLQNGDWLVGFNAGYWHASAQPPRNYSPRTLAEYRRLGMPADVVAPTGGRLPLDRPWGDLAAARDGPGRSRPAGGDRGGAARPPPGADGPPQGDICWSRDGGRTWAAPATFGMRLLAPHLHVHRDRALVGLPR